MKYKYSWFERIVLERHDWYSRELQKSFRRWDITFWISAIVSLAIALLKVDEKIVWAFLVILAGSLIRGYMIKHQDNKLREMSKQDGKTD